MQPIQDDDDVAVVRIATKHHEALSIGVNVVYCAVPPCCVGFVIEQNLARPDLHFRYAIERDRDHALLASVKQLSPVRCPARLSAAAR